MIAGIPKESRRGERRVAATADTVERLVKNGFTVLVERGAGDHAGIADHAYEAAGADLVDGDDLWARADLLLKVSKPTQKEARSVKEGAVVIAWFDGDESDRMLSDLAARKATFLALDAVPRITRAQKMDVRSSMANLAGYRAVIEAASRFGRTMGAQVTAAGTTPPAKVLVIGAGVAGLAAVAAARGLGAIVRAFDTRAAAREQVESLGAEFLEVLVKEEGEGKGGYAKVMSQAFIDAEMALFRAQAREVDIVITTALIPGRPAPKLWTADMVASMKTGSVVVDLAATRGGNCELTQPGKVVVEHGVHLVGDTDLTQHMADHASRLFARNVLALVEDIGKADTFALDLTDDVQRCVTVMLDGEVKWPAPPPDPSPPKAPPTPKPPPLPTEVEPSPPAVPARVWMPSAIAIALVLAAVGFGAPATFLQHLTVFVLACFIGWQVVWNVTPALHTPLMSVTNAISGIILVGGMLQVASHSRSASTLGFFAILFASVNLFGGFAVTQRMLAMFQRGGAR